MELGFISEIFGVPLGWVMWLCHTIVSNYGIALLLFTLIARGAMLPLTFKQQKTSAKMALIQPQMAELQKKYANNREKLAEEMNKLYQKEGYSPTAGCLPMLIQFPILFGVIDVIYKPLKHILHLPAEAITQATEIAKQINPALNANSIQIGIIQMIHEDPSAFLSIGAKYVEEISVFDLNFFGINLGLSPSLDMFKVIFSEGFNPLLLIPIMSGLTSIVMTLISMRTTTASTEAAGNAGGMMKSMFLIMPIFSFMIPFGMPAGVGLYWTYSNLVGIAQSLLMNKFYNPKKLAEQAKQEMEERQERERQERIEAKKQAKERTKISRENGEEILDEKALTQKDLNRRKLAEARKRDAERYGEEYTEVTDDDIR